MIALNTTSQVLLTSAGDVTSAALHCYAVYSDQLPQTIEAIQRRATRFISTSTTANVTSVTAPAADGIIRNIEHYTAHNATATTATVRIRILDGATERALLSTALLSGKSVVYEHGTGWQVL